ncbi:hypothetical protein Sme01_25710 [Sphaerisporangium melleum]|uniref:Uncharacterized protein n=1 Tax=Sphaerisporangium melleum TaxID=321316 RepID=A0A917QRZ4_9ACTN|nr:hypothetical protein [Sphaerisporangium melleum]GGK64356.1 hypothetical protein GCM10007964_04230 [Sphaerisporangium melleum]GII70095.1 hypothetical protein Sme01_25710 [Sphaerisporangium melleum]
MTVQDLRDVLRSHGEGPAPANPVRHEQVQARIRAIRRRRRAAATGAALSAVAVVALAFLPGRAQPGPDTVAVAPSPDRTSTPRSRPAERQEPLPRAFTAADSAEYRRLAVAAVAAAGSTKATVTVPVSGRPLDVAAVCSGGVRSSMGVRIRIGSAPTGNLLPCEKGRRLAPLVVPAGAGDRIKVSFELVNRLSGCIMAKGSCVPPDNRKVAFSLAVYEWAPPERPIEPPAPRALPEIRGYRLADTRTGTWPRDRSLAFDVLGDGRPLAIDQICTGDVASRLSFTVKVNGRLASRATCGVWTSGPFPGALPELKVPKGRKAVITVKLGMSPEAPNRPVRWSVGLWRRR